MCSRDSKVFPGFLCVPGRAKCHETSGWMQAFYAVKLPCSETRSKGQFLQSNFIQQIPIWEAKALS